MISELIFSRGHHSFWHKSFPFISRVVRKINLEKNHFESHFSSIIEPGRRALVNEIGFRLFEYLKTNMILDIKDIQANEIEKIKARALHYISGLQKSVLFAETGEVRHEEMEEASQICIRLSNFFLYNEPQKKLFTSPYFKGCGILNSCHGDVFCGDTLYEVKAGDREFRGDDVKQLLIYCSLANLQKHFNIDKVGLINPRNGYYSIISVNDAVEISTGNSVQDAFTEITNYLDSPDDFR